MKKEEEEEEEEEEETETEKGKGGEQWAQKEGKVDGIAEE